MAADDVLVITGSMIGDVVLSTGAISAILARHQGARVCVVCSPGTAILFRHAGADEVIALAKARRGGHWFDLRRRLRGRRWAAVYDFRDSVFSRLLCAPRRVPQRNKGAVTHKVVEASTILGEGGARDPVLWLSPADDARVPAPVLAADPLVVLGPGASRMGKAWPIDRFADLAARLTAPGSPLEGGVIVVTGGPMDADAAQAVMSRLPQGRVVDMTGADLLVTAAAMARASLFVGNDSGMMHLAAAAGAPTLGLFGPTDERLYGPWGERTAVVRSPLETFTFGKTSQTVRKDASQMESLTVATVQDAALALLRTVSGP